MELEHLFADIEILMAGVWNPRPNDPYGLLIQLNTCRGEMSLTHSKWYGFPSREAREAAKVTIDAICCLISYNGGSASSCDADIA